MEIQLLSLIIVIVSICMNLLLVVLSNQNKSTRTPPRKTSYSPSNTYKTDFSFDREYSLTTTLKDYEKKILELETLLREKEETIQSLNIKVLRLEGDVSQLVQSMKQSTSDNAQPSATTESNDLPHMIKLMKEYNQDYSHDSIYFEESVMTTPASKQSMNDGITVVILSSNCKEGTKIASTSIYNLNKFYPVLKVYLQNATDPNAVSLVQKVLPRIETKYTLLVDGSVEFTLNTHLKRLLNVLKSGEAVIAGGAEEDEHGVLTMRCYDLYLHNNILEHRMGYHGVFSGNCIQCERVGHHFLINTDILRNIWPTDLSLPYKLAIESMFLDAKRYNFPVASCPVSIFKYQKHQQCNPSTVSWKLIDSNSKLLFANKYKIQVIKDIDEEMDLFPLYIEHQKFSYHYESPYLYKSIHTLFKTTKDLLNKYRVPFVITGKELIGGVSVGIPVPWDNHLRLTPLTLLSRNNISCDAIDINSSMNQYFLQSKQLNAYRGRKFCISMYPSIFVDEDEEDLDDETRNRIKTKADRTNDFVDLEIMYPTSPRDLHNYLIPIKIMKFMNEYYFVPNNPILYLERENQEVTESSLKDIQLFKSQKAEDEDQVWPICPTDNDDDINKDICIQSTYQASDYILNTLLSLYNQ